MLGNICIRPLFNYASFHSFECPLYYYSMLRYPFWAICFLFVIYLFYFICCYAWKYKEMVKSNLLFSSIHSDYILQLVWWFCAGSPWGSYFTPGLENAANIWRPGIKNLHRYRPIRVPIYILVQLKPQCPEKFMLGKCRPSAVFQLPGI